MRRCLPALAAVRLAAIMGALAAAAIAQIELIDARTPWRACLVRGAHRRWKLSEAGRPMKLTMVSTS